MSNSRRSGSFTDREHESLKNREFGFWDTRTKVEKLRAEGGDRVQAAEAARAADRERLLAAAAQSDAAQAEERQRIAAEERARAGERYGLVKR